ncbi:MAG: hypothetical protein ABWY63_14190 [Hyphomicrobiaceae bacterium]
MTVKYAKAGVPYSNVELDNMQSRGLAWSRINGVAVPASWIVAMNFTTLTDVGTGYWQGSYTALQTSSNHVVASCGFSGSYFMFTQTSSNLLVSRNTDKNGTAIDTYPCQATFGQLA